MSYIEQRDKWLQEQDAKTPGERERLKKAWESGYFTCTNNWCKQTR